MKETTTALSKEEELALDRQLEQLEPQIADAKRKYDALVSQYAELFEKRHPEKQEDHIKETLFRAYQKSDRTMEQILTYMAGAEDDGW